MKVNPHKSIDPKCWFIYFTSDFIY